MAISRPSGCAHFVDSSRHASKHVAWNAVRHLKQPRIRKTTRTLRRRFKRIATGGLNNVTVHALTEATRYFKDLPRDSFR